MPHVGSDGSGLSVRLFGVVTSVSLVPDVTLVPRLGDDIATVISAADRVEELLARSGNGRVPEDVERGGFSMRDHLDPITFEQMKMLMKAAR